MVANELISQYKNLPDTFNYIGVEDFADRLSFLFTVTILLVCCSLVTLRTYVFHPLACYIPNAFGAGSASQELFVNNYCWTEGTYAVHPKQFAIEADRPDGGLGKYADKKIVYYQWVPLVLGAQCILYYLPRLLWVHVTNRHSGTDVAHILRKVSEASRSDQLDKQNRLMKHACQRLVKLLERSHNASWYPWLRAMQQRVFSRLGFDFSTRTQGNSIVLCYLGIKLIYFTNATCQLAFMQRFLNFNQSTHSLFGLKLLRDFSRGVHWQNSMIFPRIGSCAVLMKTSGSPGNWQVSQCALPINMINEKLYVFLWFWMAFVAAATAISLISWTIRVYCCGRRGGSGFVRRYLTLADNYHQLRSNPWLTKFELEFLRNDGAFLVKMIALNCGDLACTEVLRHLWRTFLALNGLHDGVDKIEDSVTVKNLTVIPTRGFLEQAQCYSGHSLDVPREMPTAPPPPELLGNEKDDLDLDLDAVKRAAAKMAATGQVASPFRRTSFQRSISTT